MNSIRIALALLPFAASSPALAVTTATDPTGDFLPSFVGTPSPDLDVTSFSVDFDGTDFTLAATLAGAINPATNALYVIGVNSGTGVIEPFADIGEPNVIFNQVVVVQGATATGAVGMIPVTVTFGTDSFTAVVPLALLPSTGFAPQLYGFNLWPRVGLGNNNQIADFAPDNALLSAVPEPGTWLTMLLGFGLVGGLLRFRRRPATATAEA